tara:strand:- start:183 stop:746 length:564 start_codon:yes stop_codon:yes gene_type:complete
MKDPETLLNVRENISLNLSDGVKNRKSDFRTFTLCTTGSIPSGRTVVLRGYDSINNIITFHTNSHAEKIQHLNLNSDVCSVFYSKSSKLQFRCFGKASINQKNKKSETSWKKMSEMSRECYFQNPLPGTKINNYDEFTKDVETKESSFFCVIDIKINKIDWLFLKREGHRRANIFLDSKIEDQWVSP